MSIDVKPIKPHIGAIVHVDRASMCDGSVAQVCNELLEDRSVLVFPRIGLSDEEQLAFTDSLGKRVYYSSNVPGGTAADPDVYKVTLDPEVNDRPEYVQATFFWHMDGLHSDSPLPKATLLSGRRVAPRGGQTEFANTIAAYENLPESEKAEIEGLRAVHSIFASMRPLYDEPTDELRARWSASVFNSRLPIPGRAPHPSVELEHPIVRTNASGRKSMILGSSADRVVGMPLPDGRALLSRLLEWAVQPDFHYRHEWHEGDLVMWNNPGALHRALPYDVHSGRALHRTTIAGAEAVN